jgi:hypothetical protein
LKSKVDDLRNFIVSNFANNSQLKDVAARAQKIWAEFPKDDKELKVVKIGFSTNFIINL